MSMTKEEAKKHIVTWFYSLEDYELPPLQVTQALQVAISALRPITREKVWRGEWEPGNPICPICGKNKFNGLDADIWADWMPNFCPHCGAPMTDKAVDMVMERMEKLYGQKDN